MKVYELMTGDVACCSMDDTLEMAARLMWEADCGVLPVVDADAHVVGVITDRDICMGALLQGRSLDLIRVGWVASKEPCCVDVDDSVEDAQSLMQSRRVRRLPVTEHGRVVGILSMNDLARNAGPESDGRGGVTRDMIARTLEAVSTPRL